MSPGNRGFLRVEDGGPAVFLNPANAKKVARQLGGKVKRLRDVWPKIVKILRDNGHFGPEGQIDAEHLEVSMDIGSGKCAIPTDLHQQGQGHGQDKLQIAAPRDKGTIPL